MRITKSLEDYLETIYLLEEGNGEAKVTVIAERMKVAKSSVHSALHNLEDKGFLIHERYGTLKLTQSGKAAAALIYKRHRSIKTFFIEIVGLDEETAEIEACAVEHILSDETIKKMARIADTNGVNDDTNGE